MIESFRFSPDADHAVCCDRAMHAGLADSLRQICDASDGKVEFDRAAIERLTAEIAAGRRLPPNAFALYYELVPALLEGSLDAARLSLTELARQQAIEAPLRVLALGDPAMADRARRYLSFMNNDTVHTYVFLPPSEDEVVSFRQRFGDVMALLQQVAPEFVSELKALISELILVTGPEDAKVHFDGGSSYQLWGALFLNVGRQRTRVDLIDALAHESAHSRLFSLCTEEALVRNADDETHASPLRTEPRPLDGVYHATFVSARMHWAMSRVIASGLLSEEELALAIKARDDDKRNFEKGYGTVAAHARLTDTGRIALNAALDYMRSAA